MIARFRLVNALSRPLKSIFACAIPCDCIVARASKISSGHNPDLTLAYLALTYSSTVPYRTLPHLTLPCLALFEC